MKKMTALFLAIGMVLLGLTFSAGAETGEKADLSALTAVEMTRLMGNGINLGNTMEACNNGASGGNTSDSPSYYETMWGQPITTAEMLKAMKEAGFDTIRIPVAWMTNATHLNKGDWTIAKPYMDRVEEIVNYALAAGLDFAKVIAIEAAEGEVAQTYANIIAVREGRENDPAIQALIDAVLSPEVADFIADTYHGQVVAIF